MFGRDLLTTWTVPHAILLLNLAVTAVAVAGLALWLGAERPAGGLAPAPSRAARQAAGVMLFVGLSMTITHMWAFVMEWEGGVSFSNLVLDRPWLYPPLAAFDAALCLGLAARLLPLRWWMPLLLVLVAQAWRVGLSPVLLAYGYTYVESFALPLTLAGLCYGLIGWAGRGWRAWARDAVFGASYVGITLLARAAGELPGLTLGHVLLVAPLLPLAAALGGWIGAALAGWLRRAAEAEYEPSAS
jgi:hypothetical protein